MQLSPTLPYVTNDPALVAPWTRETRFPKLPAWLLSALFLLAFFSFTLWHHRHWDLLPYPWLAWLQTDPSIGLPISLLLTIAIKRRGWIRAILALTATASIVALAYQLWGFPNSPPNVQSFKYSLIIAATRANTLLLAGLIWHFNFSWRSLAAIARVLFVAVTVSALDMILEDILQASGSYHHLPKDWWTNIPAESYALPFAFLSIFWLTIPWTLHPTKNLFRPLREAAFALASLTLLFAGTGYYHSGQRVVVRFFFPFHPDDAVQYDRWEDIAEEGVSDDQMFSMLQRTEWSLPWLYTPFGQGDWRWDAIHRLAKSSENHDRLFTLLRANPTLIPARYIAPTVAADHCYPATLILLRHALFDGDNACIGALQSMDLPQAAWASLENYNFMIKVNTTSKIPDFSTEFIAGPASIAPYLDPEKYYSKAECRLIVRRESQGRRAPFPDVICDQADQLVFQFARCIEAEDRAFGLYKSSSPPPTNIRFFTGWVATTYPDYDQLLLTRLEISHLLGFHPPSGDAPTLADLTRQVDQYVAELSRYQGPPPASPK